MTSTAKPSSETIIAQARQGSIAAIIQLLNESLAHLNVRTRAVLQGRILQLLCEAELPESLEAATLVPHIQQVLEAIAPPNFHRVKLYSRIVREQQLLWLEEITRNPESQVLWSEEIKLKRPNLLKRLQENWAAQRSQARSRLFAQDFSSFRKRKPRPVAHRIFLGVGVAIVLTGLGLGLAKELGFAGLNLPFRPREAVETPAKASTDPLDSPIDSPIDPSSSAGESPNPELTENPPPNLDLGPEAAGTSGRLGAENSEANSSSGKNSPGIGVEGEVDPFVKAVRLAEQASADGKTASTRAEWLDLAHRWQQASDLMKQVPVDDPRYATAQDRVVVYQRNSNKVLQEATGLP